MRFNTISRAFQYYLKEQLSYFNNHESFLYKQFLADINKVGGEGLMLRKPGSLYEHKRSTTLQNRINTLYSRYNDYLITASDLLNGLSLVVAKKVMIIQ